MAKSKITRSTKLPVKRRNDARRVTEKTIDCMVSDYYGADMSVAAISKKYGFHYQTVYRHINANKHMEEYYRGLNPEPLKKREELPELERIDLISKDSLSVIEKTLALINQRLISNITINEKGVIVGETDKLNLKELAVIISEITPYVIEKKVGRPKNQEETKRGNVFELMKGKKIS